MPDQHLNVTQASARPQKMSRTAMPKRVHRRVAIHATPLHRFAQHRLHTPVRIPPPRLTPRTADTLAGISGNKNAAPLGKLPIASCTDPSFPCHRGPIAALHGAFTELPAQLPFEKPVPRFVRPKATTQLFKELLR